MKVFVAFMVFVFLPIAFVLAVGMFFSKNKSLGRATGLSEELENFKRDHPGKKGKIIYYGMILLFLLVVGVRAFNFFKGY